MKLKIKSGMLNSKMNTVCTAQLENELVVSSKACMSLSWIGMAQEILQFYKIRSTIFQ